MEMRDLDNAPQHDESSSAIVDPGTTQSLERTDRTALVLQPESADDRSELYARLRTILDTATKSIRALKAENAALASQNTEMLGQIGALERRIRAVTTDLANDELALRRAAEGLEQALQREPTAAPQASAARPTPLRASEPASAPSMAPGVDPSAETGPIAMASKADSQTDMAETAEAEAQPATEEPAAMPESDAPDASPVRYGAGSDGTPAPAARPAALEDGSYTLIAFPFVRFSDLGQFQAALQKLAGVHDVQVRRFAQGTLEMRVGYTGTTDLATALRTLVTEVEDVQEEEPSRLRVRLRTSQDA